MNNKDQKMLEEVYLNILNEEDFSSGMDMSGAEMGLPKHREKLNQIIPNKVSEILNLIKKQIESTILELSTDTQIDIEDVKIDAKNNIIDGVLKGLDRM